MEKIKLFVMDVDGTMTDGKIYMSANGELFKAFDIKDGFGICEILHAHGVVTAIVTGRTSDIVFRRAEELNIKVVLQGVKDKKNAIIELKDRFCCTKSEVAYIGDDLGDIPAMKECAYVACPNNAVEELKKICTYVCQKNGGEGAVREFICWLESQRLLP